MKNTFNNCTFNTVINNNIYIDSSDSKDSSSSDSNSSLIIGTIALAGIGHFLYPTALPLIIAKAVSLAKIGLTVGATVSGGLAISTIVGCILENKKLLNEHSSNQPLILEDVNCTEILDRNELPSPIKEANSIEILDRNEQPLLLENNYSNNISNDLLFKNHIKEACVVNKAKSIGIKQKKKAV